MNSPRKQFILLGLVCQALAWEGYSILAFYGLAWWVVLNWKPDFGRMTPRFEGIVLILGCAFGVVIGSLPQQTPHFFLGHGLAFLQLVRLPRVLKERERTQTVLIAFLHLGVACTVVLDYRFLLLLMAALVLIPRMLMELEHEGFSSANTGSPPKRRLSYGAYALLLLTMVGLFVSFPRGLIGTPLQLRRGGAEGSLADAMMDPSQGGFMQSSSVLLQIEGTNVNYLRTLALPFFDGKTWRSEERPVMVRRFFPNFSPPDPLLRRRVRVKDSRIIDRMLPADGRVAHVKGKFFRDAYLNLDGTVQTVSMWNTGNNLYEYWTRVEPFPERLPARLRQRLIESPAPSLRLRAWLDAGLSGLTAPLDRARHLEEYLRNNFEYKIGAPELDRVNTLDDFMFNQKQGHCERFASALALLLRMEGIPSRVMVGYVPGRPNNITGWRNVRFRDAHAWTEAWFEDIGWVQFDATPRGTMELPDSYLADMLYAIDVIWYLNIVNYDVPTQREFFAQVGARIGSALAAVRDNVAGIGAAVASLLALGWLWMNRSRLRWSGLSRGQKKRPEAVAGYFYGEMLRTLSKQGIHREPTQTPREFLVRLEQDRYPGLAEARAVTDFFCRHRYGGGPVSDEEERDLGEVVGRMKSAKLEPGRR